MYSLQAIFNAIPAPPSGPQIIIKPTNTHHHVPYVTLEMCKRLQERPHMWEDEETFPTIQGATTNQLTKVLQAAK